MPSMYTQFNSSRLSEQNLDEVRQAREAQFAEIKEAQLKLAQQQRDLDEMIRKATNVPLITSSHYTTTESQPARSSTDTLPTGVAQPPEPRAVFTGTWSGKTGEWHQDVTGAWKLQTPHIAIHITSCSRRSQSICRITNSLE